MNLPNSITLARLALTVVYVAAAFMNGHQAKQIAFVAFCIAAITDWLDGYLARKMNLVTNIGKLLDPLVDKILVCAAFVHLSVEQLVPFWMTVLIIAREFLVTGLRQLAMEKGEVIAADKWGKLKTIMQITFIITALLYLLHDSTPLYPLTKPDGILFQSSLWLSIILTILSGLNYLRSAKKLFYP